MRQELGRKGEENNELLATAADNREGFSRRVSHSSPNSGQPSLKLTPQGDLFDLFQHSVRKFHLAGYLLKLYQCF